MSHKFAVGQTVMFTPGVGEIAAARVPVMATITRLLPRDGVDFQSISRSLRTAWCGGRGKISFSRHDRISSADQHSVLLPLCRETDSTEHGRSRS